MKFGAHIEIVAYLDKMYIYANKKLFMKKIAKASNLILRDKQNKSNS